MPYRIEVFDERQDHWTRPPICNAGRSKRGNVEDPDTARLCAQKAKAKPCRCHPAIVVGSAALVVCALSIGKISRAWIASSRFLSSQPPGGSLSWMSSVSYYASSAAVNPEYLAIRPRMACGMFGLLLYIAAVPSSLRQRELLVGLSFSLAGRRVPSSLASPRHEQPMPLEKGFAYRAVGAKSRGCVRFRLSHVVPWSAGCGNLPS